MITSCPVFDICLLILEYLFDIGILIAFYFDNYYNIKILKFNYIIGSQNYNTLYIHETF